jgi:hypothetical protein
MAKTKKPKVRIKKTKDEQKTWFKAHKHKASKINASTGDDIDLVAEMHGVDPVELRKILVS